MTEVQPTLIYISDPMCSWCYGFSEEFSKLVEKHQDINIQIVMGGLRPYNTEIISGMAEMLKHHWEQVAERSNQKFNYGILNDNQFVYDTEPPARAVVIVRDLFPKLEIEFLKRVHKAFYLENLNTNDVKTYAQILTSLGVDGSEFETKFVSDYYKEKVKKDFQYAADLGVRGFPSLVLRVEEEFYLVSNGYAKAEEVSDRIERVLQTAH